jgi:hypothetical protein
MKYLFTLGSAAAIRSGHPFRSKVKHTPEAWDYYVLQLKDVQKDQPLDPTRADQVKIEDKTPPQPLRRGDVLLRARGGYYYAALFDTDTPNVLAAGQFFVLTPDPKRLDPTYLCWYLNEPEAQLYLDKNQSGSNIPMISKRTVSELAIPLPPLDAQRRIAAIHQCWLDEKRLTEQLLDNRERMVRGICQQYISGKTP